MNDSRNNSDLDWEKRVLCSDESCIGTIGPDGRCQECGLPYQGDLPLPEADDSADDSENEEEAQAQEDAAEAPEEDSEEERPDEDHGDDEWSRRRLCSDESCIGVIGPDGLCKECGKPYQS